MFKLFKKDEGFTLVELMVVVLIIGVLVAIAIPIFNNASKQAKIRTCDANIRTINGAISQYAAVEGKAVSELTEADINTKVLGDNTYLKEKPVCPFEEEYQIGADNFVSPHTH